MRHSQFYLLTQRRFTPLFIVQFFGVFNDNLFKNALIALLTYRLADSLGLNITLHLNIANAVFMLPFALIAPTAGQIADGMDKAIMMRWVKALELLLMLLGVAALYFQSLAGLYMLVFLMGAQSAIFAPVKYGVLPQYLREDELLPGNALIQAATFIGILVGQLLGAVLILWSGGAWWVAGVTITGSIIGLVASFFAPSAPPLGPAPKVDYLLPRTVVKVVAEVSRLPVTWGAVLSISWFWFVGAGYMALLPDFARRSLGADNSVYVLLLTTFSIGVAIGALLCNRIYRGEVKVGAAPWGAAGIAFFSLTLFFAARAYLGVYPPPAETDALIDASAFVARSHAWPVILSLLGLAACAGIYLTPLNALMQKSAPPNERARVIAVSNVVDAGTMVLSAPVNISLAALGCDTPLIYLIIGATGLGAAVLVARFSRRAGV